jgi:hypothetical protein
MLVAATYLATLFSKACDSSRPEAAMKKKLIVLFLACSIVSSRSEAFCFWNCLEQPSDSEATAALLPTQPGWRAGTGIHIESCEKQNGGLGPLPAPPGAIFCRIVVTAPGLEPRGEGAIFFKAGMNTWKAILM